jgi:Meiotically up-regulated gene 113
MVLGHSRSSDSFEGLVLRFPTGRAGFGHDGLMPSEKRAMCPTSCRLLTTQYYKIGRSNAVGRRAYKLAIQLPEKAITVHSIRTDDPAGIEHYWHRRFKTKHKNGEWYELSSPDVRAFKPRKFM